MNRFAMLLCAAAFLLSGASALTYEILWQRQMFLIFGASAPATTAILTAIFLGIALGSRLAVPLMRRFANPATLYAGIEAVIGIWGFLVPTTLLLADGFYVSATASLGEGHWTLYPLRFVLAVLSLLPATLAMGATIPVMVRCVVDFSSFAVAWTYGVNILGAVVGCLLTGIVWLRVLGIHDTRLVAVGLNAAAVAIILGMQWNRSRSGIRWDVTSTQGPSVASPSSPEERLAPLGFGAMYFVAGFVALGMEVVWLRFLGIVNTNSTTTFTLTLTLYLLGMGLGSLILYPLLNRIWTAREIFSLTHAGTALGSLITFGVVYWAATVNHEQINIPSREGTLTLAGVYWTEAKIIGCLMLLPTLFMGLAYPAVCDSFQGTGPPRDRWIGRSYFWGTLGAVAGILFVSLWIIPWLGLHGTFALLVSLSALMCYTSRSAVRKSAWQPATLVACLGLVGWAGYIAHDPRPVLRETIAVKQNGQWVEVLVADRDQVHSELVRIRDGATATVMLKKTPGVEEYLVYVDDQLVASTNLEAKVDALMLAHLPLLLHPDPQSALTVGFGSGGTSDAMTTHDVETYCVEIESEVVRSAHLLKDQNHNVMEHPQFHLILNDARDHLHAGNNTYDVIATDVTNLQYKQNGNLYTVEYFDLMREKLNPEGIACAWIPMAAISTRELQILMKSFREVFPHATLWFMNHTHTNFGILIGTPHRLAIDYNRLVEGFDNEQIARNLKLIGMTEPMQFIHCLHLDEVGYGRFCGDVPLHTDDLPILEFSSPMSFYQYYETFRDNLEKTLRWRPDDFRPYVKNAPSGLEAEFERHNIASTSFCEVILLFYRYQLNRARGLRESAEANLNAAVDHANRGMQAWPEDVTRETFYRTILE